MRLLVATIHLKPNKYMQVVLNLRPFVQWLFEVMVALKELIYNPCLMLHTAASPWTTRYVWSGCWVKVRLCFMLRGGKAKNSPKPQWAKKPLLYHAFGAGWSWPLCCEDGGKATQEPQCTKKHLAKKAAGFQFKHLPGVNMKFRTYFLQI